MSTILPLARQQPFARVKPSVSLEGVGECSSVPTFFPLTSKRLLPRMGASVPRQPAWRRKELATLLKIAAVSVLRHGCAARRVRHQTSFGAQSLPILKKREWALATFYPPLHVSFGRI